MSEQTEQLEQAGSAEESVRAPFGNFPQVRRAVDAVEELAAPVAELLGRWDAELARQVLYVDTDPELADTAVFCAAYDVPAEASANCVVVAAKRGGETTLAAGLVLATTRLDVNKAVRSHLGARKASFAPMDTAVGESGMEYGGITPSACPRTGRCWSTRRSPPPRTCWWAAVGGAGS